MNNDFDLYDGKRYSDLLKDIVKNHKNKQSQIKQLTQQLVEMVSEPGEAVLLVPLIKGYLDSDIKNDEALVKLAQIVQRANQGAQKEDTFADIESLFKDIQTMELPAKTIKELPSN